MDERTDSAALRLLIPVAGWVVLSAVFLRWCASAGASGLGTNVFVHALVLAGATAWLAGAALRGKWTFRWTGPGVAFLLFALLGLVSVQRASYKLSALEHAYVYGTLAVLYFAILNLFATRRHLLLTLLFGFVLVVSLYSILQRFAIFPHVRVESTGDPRRASPEFEARLLSNEVFGTFFYPNTLAGFLALALPVIAGFLFDARGKVRGLAAVPLAGGLFALALTGSMGGWVAAGAGFLLLGALLATRGRERLRRFLWTACGTGAAVVVALVIAGPLAPGRLRNESMRMRDIYWSAAAKIAKDHPGMGVGLDNFREFYPAYRSDAQQEVKRAHNDYLQVLAELGIPGALAFLAFLFGTVACGARPRAETPPAETERGERWKLSVAGVAAMLLATVFTGAFAEFSRVTLLLVAGGWLAFAAFAHDGVAQTARGPLEGTHLGAVAGFTALLVHMAVDFDFYDYGVATALVAAAALIPILGGRARTVEVDRIPLALAGLLLLALLVPALILAPRLLDADRAKDEADKETDLAFQAEAKAVAAEAKGDMDQARRFLAEAAGSYTRALESVAEGEKLNFLDSEFYLRRASLTETLWERLRARKTFTDAAVAEMAVQEDTALQAIANALRVRPRSFTARSAQGFLHRKLAAFCLEAAAERGDRASLFRQQSLHHRIQAAEAFQEALKLYPGHAPARYFAARTIDEGAPFGAAREHYAAALRLSTLAGRERLVRLQLDVWQRARALARLDRKPEAESLLRDHFRAQLSLRNQRPAQQRMAIKDFLGVDRKGDKLRATIGDEYEGFMKEMIDGVLLEILKGLPTEPQ
ncbi:MAG: O-antigen ligase family protein [Planctomycetes bacterium]|nr:O-antigen ligase family protein [Planctomycetota bacterium]